MAEPRQAPEIDFLAALAPRKLLVVAVGCVVGAAVGFAIGHAFLRTYEAKAAIRVATVGLFGPSLPIAEVKARAESKSNLRAILKQLGAEDPEKLANKYKVLAENDGAPENPVVQLAVTGPDMERVGAVCTRITDGLMQVSHEAYVQALREQGERLSQAEVAAQKAEPAATAPEQRAKSAEAERWVGEAASLRMASRALIAAHDSEILDQPYAQESPAKKLILAALGAFVGMLVGLSFAVRPARG